jgi:CBS domain-containing protein
MIGFGIVILLRGDVVSGLWFAILGWFLGQAARGAVASSRFTERLEGVTAADVMDAQPVSLPAATPVLAAHEDWFLRYRWPWFPVVDELGRLRGILREEDVQRALADGRPALAVGELLGPRGPEDAVLRDTPVEAMLGIEPIRSLGAVMVVDADERLCGVVTAEQLRRALAAAAAPQR